MIITLNHSFVASKKIRVEIRSVTKVEGLLKQNCTKRIIQKFGERGNAR